MPSLLVWQATVLTPNSASSRRSSSGSRSAASTRKICGGTRRLSQERSATSWCGALLKGLGGVKMAQRSGRLAALAARAGPLRVVVAVEPATLALLGA